MHKQPASQDPPAANTLPREASDSRLSGLDLTRGVAILGILPVHISIFGGSGFTPQQGTGDNLLTFTMMLVEGKMVTVLAILFGVGLAIQSDRAAAKGRGFTRYYVRRMLFLFLIGLAHALLLFHWDILTSYAVVGLAALWCHRLNERVMKRVAAGCFGWCYALILVCMLVAVMFPDQSSMVSESVQQSPTIEGEQTEQPIVNETAPEPETEAFFSVKSAISGSFGTARLPVW